MDEERGDRDARKSIDTSDVDSFSGGTDFGRSRSDIRQGKIPDLSPEGRS